MPSSSSSPASSPSARSQPYHPHHQPSLSDLFERTTAAADQPTPITLGNLAVGLNVPVARLAPLVREGYLRLVQQSPHPALEPRLDSSSYIESPPQRALLWLRQWFQPARGKQLFSLADMAELLMATDKEVVWLAARAGIPVNYEAALGGLVFSAWSAKKLLREQASTTKAKGGGRVSKPSAVRRFDRQALLHMLLEADPRRALQPPDFDDLLEEEIERVAGLPAEQRRRRALALWEQWQDAKKVAEAVRPASESAVADQRRQVELDLKFERLKSA